MVTENESVCGSPVKKRKITIDSVIRKDKVSAEPVYGKTTILA